MNDELDTSFRWPAVDEQFAMIALVTSACFSLFFQILARQPPVTDKADLLAMFSQANAPLPHNLGLTWSELMTALGCTGTDPNAPLCEALAQADRRSKDEQLASYLAEAKPRAASLVIAKVETRGVQGALDDFLKETAAPRVTVDGSNEPCRLPKVFCPDAEPVHVVCAKKVAPKTIVTGAILVHVLVAVAPSPTVTIIESTISSPAVERCIVQKLKRQRWLTSEEHLRFDFARR